MIAGRDNTDVIKTKPTYMEAKWHAVYTKTRWEKKVAELLTKRKIESYCPLNLVVRQWSDRKKKVYEPLFPTYVFVHVTQKQQAELRQIPGVVNLVRWLNKPAVIKDKEIQAIRDFLNEYKSVQLEKAAVSLNDTVRVLRGPLIDCQGNVIEIKKKSVKVILPSLGYLICAQVQRSNIEVVTSNNLTSVGSPSYQLAEENF